MYTISDRVSVTMEGNINNVKSDKASRTRCGNLSSQQTFLSAIHIGLPEQPTVPSPIAVNENDMVSCMTVKDLNKAMFENFTRMQEHFIQNVIQDLQVMIPELIKSSTEPLYKELSELKKDYEKTKQDLINMKTENENIKKVLGEHQRFLSSVDSEKRSANVIITGVPENVNDIGVDDRKMVEKILEEIHCSGTVLHKTERLGRTTVSSKRPIKVTLAHPADRERILSNARRLKQSNCEQLKKVYVKKDANPLVRQEQARLREVLRREKEKPENTGKQVKIDYKQNKVFVGELEIDSFQIQHF